MGWVWSRVHSYRVSTVRIIRCALRLMKKRIVGISFLGSLQVTLCLSLGHWTSTLGCS